MCSLVMPFMLLKLTHYSQIMLKISLAYKMCNFLCVVKKGSRLAYYSRWMIPLMLLNAYYSQNV